MSQFQAWQPKSVREEREQRRRDEEARKKEDNIRASLVGIPLIDSEREHLVSTVWRCAHGIVPCEMTTAVAWGYWNECRCAERLGGTYEVTA